MANKINLIDVDAVIRKLERELEIIPTISLVKDPFGTVFDTPLDRRIRRLVSALIRDVINYLKRQPTVDAVEVVRCKDCKKWDPKTRTCEEFTTHRFPAGGRVAFLTQETDFCSYGERGADA